MIEDNSRGKTIQGREIRWEELGDRVMFTPSTDNEMETTY
jgi:hypothetical protein